MNKLIAQQNFNFYNLSLYHVSTFCAIRIIGNINTKSIFHFKVSCHLSSNQTKATFWKASQYCLHSFDLDIWTYYGVVLDVFHPGNILQILLHTRSKALVFDVFWQQLITYLPFPGCLSVLSSGKEGNSWNN